jgi:hypothetical protein
MTELPELPPAPRRTRPLPAGGLEGAIAAGRSRRHRALAAASGTATALALVVAGVVVLPGGGPDSLSVARKPAPAPAPTSAPADSAETTEPAPVPTEPASVPTGSVPVPPGSADLPGVLAPQQRGAQELPGSGGSARAPGATREPAAPSGSARQPAPGGQAQPAPGSGATSAPARPPSARPAYREDTDEDADGAAGCKPSTMTAGTTAGGPDGTASTASSSCTYSSGFFTGDVVRRGEQAQVVLGYCKGQDSGDDVYFFGGGQEKDVVVTTEHGVEEVFRFSLTVRYVEGAHERRLRPGKCLQWTGRWDLVTTDGRPVPAGTYRMTMTVRADRHEQPFTEPRGYEETVSTKITVVD